MKSLLMKHLKAFGLAAALVCAGHVPGFSADVIRVDVNGSGDYTNMADALAVAQEGDTLLVMPGVYQGTKNRDLVIDKSLTIKSSAGSGQTTFKANGTVSSPHRVFEMKTPASRPTPIEVHLEGVTLNRGYAHAGGLILASQVHLTVKSCVFKSSSANFGGAVYASGGNFYFIDGEVKNNKAAHFGGGLLLMEQAAGGLKGSAFQGNRASFGAGAWIHGGTWNIWHTTFTKNHAVSGGGVFAKNAYVSFINGLLSQNTGSVGSAYYQDQGWAGFAFTTLAENQDTVGTALYFEDVEGSFLGSIAWGNLSQGAVPAWCTLVSSSLAVRYSNLELAQAGVIHDDSSSIGWFANSSADPLFVQGPLGKYYLSHPQAGQDERSPCINKVNDIGYQVLYGPILGSRTVRTDEVIDGFPFSMGYHHTVTAP